MPEIEKVIKDLEKLCNGKSSNIPFVCYDALELLKERQPKKPHYTTLRYIVKGKDVSVKHPECPRCVENGLHLWNAEIEIGQAFCKRCGQAIDWGSEDGDVTVVGVVEPKDGEQ